MLIVPRVTREQTKFYVDNKGKPRAGLTQVPGVIVRYTRYTEEKLGLLLCLLRARCTAHANMPRSLLYSVTMIPAVYYCLLSVTDRESINMRQPTLIFRAKKDVLTMMYLLAIHVVLLTRNTFLSSTAPSTPLHSTHLLDAERAPTRLAVRHVVPSCTSGETKASTGFNPTTSNQSETGR